MRSVQERPTGGSLHEGRPVVAIVERTQHTASIGGSDTPSRSEVPRLGSSPGQGALVRSLARNAPVFFGPVCDMKTLSNHPYVGLRGSLSWGHNWGDIARVEPSSLSRFPRNDLTSVGITSAVRSLGDPRMAGIEPQESSRLGRTATSLMCTSAEASTTKRTARATDAGRM